MEKSDGGRWPEGGRQSELSAHDEDRRQINALSGKKTKGEKKTVQGTKLGCWVSREPERMCVHHGVFAQLLSGKQFKWLVI